MISRFNYTNRQKIPRDHVRFSLIEYPEGPFQFAGHVNLALPVPLDPSAHVIVEAYSGPVVMRFHFGTVGNQHPPENTILDQFPPGLRPYFRVKVVAPGPDRRILAVADGVTPFDADERNTGRHSILPVETVDLGARVWNLRFEGNEVRLQLNSAIREPRDITSLAREHDFLALVYPAVVSQILHRLLLGPEHEALEPDHDWLIFASRLAGREAPHRNEADDAASDADDFTSQVYEWIEDVVSGFCSQNNSAEAFMRFKRDKEDLVNA